MDHRAFRISASRPVPAFTILEVLAAAAVLSVLFVLLSAMVGRTSSVWSSTRGQVEQFREARDAFEVITRRLGEATLNTYLDYEDASGLTRTAATATSFVPKTYGRQSELRFLSGPGVQGDSHAVFFQSPAGRFADGTKPGAQRLLNTMGYFISYGGDAAGVPPFVATRDRLRLWELCEPTESLSVYQWTSGNASAADRTSWRWFSDPLSSASPPILPVAENIVALVLLPLLPSADRLAGNFTESSLAPDYVYDSTSRRQNPALNPRNQLPALVRVTMVAIDEKSALRLGAAGHNGLRALVSSLFRNADNYDRDLRALEAELTRLGAAYRVFSTQVPLKNSKWSRDQKG